MAGSSIRVRLAPSPTGMMHVGNARTALFNWAFARKNKGTLVLRIEDTDVSRNRPEWTDGILDALHWLGIGQNEYEGPYFQSENAAHHRGAVTRLFAKGYAYYCSCTREQVVARTGSPQRGYDGYCRDRGLGPGPTHAVRFRTPDEGKTIVKDLIRGKDGENPFPNEALEDFVIARGDGSPTFLLANVVDDMDMEITHVIRGEEHLANAAKQQLLWKALGAPQPPTWAHVPILINEKKQKLSKRRDRVSLEDFRNEGYLPSAMRNYLMLLGWSPSGDREIVPWEVIEAEFRLRDVNPSPAEFDVVKLRALNGHYIRALSEKEFIDACQPWLTKSTAPWPTDRFDPDVFARLVPLIQTRMAVLSEVAGLVDFFFLEQPVIDHTAWDKVMRPPANEIIDHARESYKDAPWDVETLKTRLTDIGLQHGLKLGKAQAPIRVAITGRTVGPPLFESLVILGRERTLDRLDATRDLMRAG